MVYFYKEDFFHLFLSTFPVLSDAPTSFTITVTSDTGENEETLELTLKFTYVEKYPDEPPLWEIFSQENLEDSDAEEILTLLKQQVCTSDIIHCKNMSKYEWSRFRWTVLLGHESKY